MIKILCSNVKSDLPGLLELDPDIASLVEEPMIFQSMQAFLGKRICDGKHVRILNHAWLWRTGAAHRLPLLGFLS